MKRCYHKIQDDLKRRIVEEYLNTNKSQKELMQEYNIREKGAIKKWMLNFGISQPTQEQIELQLIMSKETTNKTKRELELEAQIEELKKDLDTERFRTKALNKMIDIIERDLKIPVRKKSGTKQ